MIGAWLFGTLADKYGRKKIIFLALLGCILTGVGSGVATSFLMFAVFRFLLGLMNQAMAVVGFALTLEVVGASKRSFVAVLGQAFFSLGLCLLVVLAYYIRDWRTLTLFNSLLGVGFLGLWK